MASLNNGEKMFKVPTIFKPSKRSKDLHKTAVDPYGTSGYIPKEKSRRSLKKSFELPVETDESVSAEKQSILEAENALLKFREVHFGVRRSDGAWEFSVPEAAHQRLHALLHAQAEAQESLKSIAGKIADFESR